MDFVIVAVWFDKAHHKPTGKLTEGLAAGISNGALNGLVIQLSPCFGFYINLSNRSSVATMITQFHRSWFLCTCTTAFQIVHLIGRWRVLFCVHFIDFDCLEAFYFNIYKYCVCIQLKTLILYSNFNSKFFLKANIQLKCKLFIIKFM